MSGERALFDSNIIVYLSKKEIPYEFVERFEIIRISVITYMEILGYRFSNDREEDFIKELVGLFETVYINQIIAEKVINIRKTHTIKLPDAIIAATAICENLMLVTRNTEDFKKLDVPLIDPFLIIGGFNQPPCS